MDKKTITKEIQDLEILESLTSAYAEISSGRMKKTRSGVLSSRDFLSEIQAIFKELQESYRDEVLRLARKKGFKKGEKITFLSHNGRSVAVFISTNTGFYGDLTKKVFDKFIKELENRNFEATIVGKLGLTLFKQTNPDKSYSYFDLPDYGSDPNQMSDLIKHLVEYEEIHIFYGKFQSLVNQSADEVIISAQTLLSENPNPKRTRYLFEPNLEDILIFFEREMFSSIFDQTISESQLAKFASRMIAMDTAGERIRQYLENSKANKLKIMHATANKKQLETVSSVILGRKFA